MHLRHALIATCLLAAAYGLPAARPVAAQSVSPPLAEYKGRARSSFQLRNGSIYPLTAVLEVKGFDITEQGEVIDVPFDTSRVHLKLSAMSFRIPARGTYTVFYEATADSLPAWFNILSAMNGLRSVTGLTVRILLPHVVYLNQKRSLRREEVMVRRFEYDAGARKSRVLLENIGPNLGRVLDLTVANDGSGSPPSGGLPLLPGHRRWVEVPWEAEQPPDRVHVRFTGFTIDTLMTVTTAALASDSTPGEPRR